MTNGASDCPAAGASPQDAARPGRVPAGRPALRGRLAWLLGVALALALCLGAASIWVWRAGPEWLRAEVQERGRTLIGRPVHLGAVELHWQPLGLSLHQLRLCKAGEDCAAAAGPPPEASLSRLRISVDAGSLLRGVPEVEELAIDGLRAVLQRQDSGAWSFDDLLARVAAAGKGENAEQDPASAAAVPAIVLRNAVLRDAALEFDDRQGGRRHTLSAVQMELPWLSTLPADADRPAALSLRAQLDGQAFTLEATAHPMRPRPSLQAHLRAQALDLSPCWAWLPPELPLRPTGGRLDADLRLRAELAGRGNPGAPPDVEISGQTAVRDLALGDPKGAELLSWSRLTVDWKAVRPLQQRIDVAGVRLEGARLRAQRDPQGRWRLPAGWVGDTPVAAQPARSQEANAQKSQEVQEAQEVQTAQNPHNAPLGATGSRGDAVPWVFSAGPIELVDARVWVLDQAAAPGVTTQLDALNLRVEGLQWPWTGSASQLHAKASARVAVGSRAAARLAVEAALHPEGLNLSWQVGALELGALMPYLGPLTGLELQGQLQARGTAAAKWAKPQAAVSPASPAAWSGRIDGLRLRDVQAGRPGQPAGLQIRDLRLEQLRLDLARQRIDARRFALEGPQLSLRRRADGDIELPVALPASLHGAHGAQGAQGAQSEPRQAAAPAPGAQAQAQAKARAKVQEQEQPWAISLGQFSLDGGRLSFTDERLRDVEEASRPLTAVIQGLRLQAEGLRWPPPPLPVPFGLELALGGAAVAEAQAGPALRVQGRLGLQNPGFAGRVEVQAWPLWRFEPYLAEFGIAIPVRLSRGELGLAADLDLASSSEGWQVDAQGAVRLADVQWLARPRGLQLSDGSQELLSWNALRADPVRVRWASGHTPMVRIGEVRLEDAFARLQITPAGRLNLQEAVELQGPLRQGEEASVSAATAPAAAPTPTPTPTQTQTQTQTAAPAAGRPVVDLAVERTVLVNGRVDFFDRFIRPNYRAELSELNGSFGRFESGSTALAPLELSGRAAGTARVEIRGRVNPLAEPLALDLSARLTDLELSPLSPYGTKYIGHAIERGKLSMDLSYRIEPDGRLQARNQIILNQLTLGERVASASAVNWPIRFVLSLLADRNGVIDVDLPISGSLQDPQFSLWGLVWKVLGNLVTRVVTAPFSWLAGGASAQAQHVAFDAGSAVLPQGAGPALDAVARALGERPAMRLTLSGSADPAGEAASLKAALVQERLQALWRREQARVAALPKLRLWGGSAPASSDAAAAPLPAPGSAQHLALLRQLYRESPLADKPRNALGQLRDLPPDQMLQRLVQGVELGEVRLRELALARAMAVREALVARGLAPQRVFVGEPRLAAAAPGPSPADGAQAVAGRRVELQLSVP